MKTLLKNTIAMFRDREINHLHESLYGSVPFRQLKEAVGNVTYYKRMLAVFLLVNTLVFLAAVVYFV